MLLRATCAVSNRLLWALALFRGDFYHHMNRLQSYGEALPRNLPGIQRRADMCWPTYERGHLMCSAEAHGS
ncbi:hypothetical protein DAEQUDRAFT_727425 [Daedalea quercina L-15889]|uniref:Uncharacterized protein n=1 Tax=Daedalea quercina L-15889 TaxID=1314783 RepID=A0A165PYE3_9APHY|nr:hypothetical protein DAEQUDRAFT_727425 [Daedalea quercina L-15889]